MSLTSHISTQAEATRELGQSQESADASAPPGDRLRQTLLHHDIKGEKASAAGQAAISAFILVLHLLAQFSNDWQSINLWVITALAGLITSSVIRLLLVRDGCLRERSLDFLTAIDISIFLALIWGYQFAYDHAAGGVLKAPSFILLAALIALRALRFHPRPIIIAGATAAIGWCLIVFMSLYVDGTVPPRSKRAA
jgi:adenylate cyclase